MMQSPENLIPIAGMLTGIVVTLVLTFVLGVPIVRAIVSRFERKPPTVESGETRARLERIEQAVEGIALEVERIAEGQRFTSKLLAERATEEARRKLEG